MRVSVEGRSEGRSEGKWRRDAPLKSRWYDDHYGHSALERIDNRVRDLDEPGLKGDETQVSTSQVERFFDLFDERRKG
jgi:hypothetical protein